MRPLLVTLSLLAATAEAAPPRKVTVTRRDLERNLTVPATVAPRVWAELTAPASGVVQAIYVDIGSQVKKGQLLSTVLPAGPAPHGKALPLFAPFDGVVTARWAQVGVFVTLGTTPMFALVDDAGVALVLAVPEAEIALVRIGQPVRARFEAYPQRIWVATLSRMVRAVDARTHTLAAQADLDNPDRSLMMGMSCSARIEVEARKNALTAPRAAVQLGEGGPFVFRVENGMARRAPVRLGIESDDTVELLEGAVEGETLVMGDVKDGDAIK
jgi:multidrug efflux pump subunit AcrA (membrane-fusion protein)